MGIARAQYKLADLYHLGLGVPANLGEALRWLRISADQGYIPAQMGLGILFLRGEGAIPPDDVESFKWFQRAALQASARGQNALGNMYFDGRGVERNDHEAVRWYRLAAEQGNPLAQNSLGYAYQEGLGVDRDDKLAAHWYRRAMQQDLPEARKSMVLQYLRGRATPEPSESILELFEKVEQEGDPQAVAAIAAAVSLAGRYGMPRDVETAMRVARGAHLKSRDIALWFDDLYLRETEQADRLLRNLEVALDSGEASVVAFLKEFDEAVPNR
ncbi:MAG: tetratricopeptide repeat protein [Acidobacteriota bacterium]